MKGVTGKGPIAVVGTLLLVLSTLLGGAVAQAAGPGISLDPTTGVVNTQISVTATGFPTDTVITITFGGQTVVTGTTPTDTAAAFTSSFAAPLKPFGAVTVSGTAGSSTTSTIFTLIGPAQIAITPTAGIAGDVVTMTGTDFAATDTITVTFGGSPVSTTPAVITTDHSGDFTATFVVPAPSTPAGLGVVTVMASDTKGQNDTETFTLKGVVNQNTGAYFPTIQAAINAASTTTAQTIVVGPGTFNENITIDRALTLSARDGPGVTTISGVLTGTPVALITGNNVTLGNGGFKLVNGSIVVTSSVVAIGSGVNGTVVQNNVIDASKNNFGVVVVSNSLTATTPTVSILRNTITGAATSSTNAGIRINPGQMTVSIANNFINGNAMGISAGVGVSAVVNNNNLAGNTGLAIAWGGPTSLDASGNWWGTVFDSGILLLVSGPVDFTPFLSSGTDTDFSTPGFQGDFSVLRLSSLGGQTGAVGRVQEGVNKTVGSAVIVNPGTYLEAVTIGKSGLTLKSTGGAVSTIIDSTGKGSATINVTAANVTIGGVGGGFTLRGSTFGVLASGAANLVVSGNTILPVGSTGVDATNSPGTQVVGGSITVNTPNEGTGVFLKDSGNGSIRDISIDIQATLTGTGVWLSNSPTSTVANLNANVSTTGTGAAFGVRVGGSAGSTVKDSNISVHAAGNATGVSVVDSPGTTISNINGVSLTSAFDGVVSSLKGTAAGVRLVRSGNSKLVGSFFDIFTEMSSATGVDVSSSPGVLVDRTDAGVRSKAGPITVVRLSDSPGSTVSNGTFDTEMLSLSLSSSTGVQVVSSSNVTLQKVKVKVTGNNGPATGIMVQNSGSTGLFGSSLSVSAKLSFSTGVDAISSTALTIRDTQATVTSTLNRAEGFRLQGSGNSFIISSFFDVFTAMDTNGGSFASSPGSTVSSTRVRLGHPNVGVGLRVTDSFGTRVLDSFFDVFTELSVTGADVTNSGGGMFGGNEWELHGATGVGLRLRESPTFEVSDSFFDIFTEVSGTGADVMSSPDVSIGGSTIIVDGGETVTGVRVSRSPGASVFGTIIRNVVTSTPPEMAVGVLILNSPGAAVSEVQIDLRAGRAQGVVVNNGLISLNAVGGSGQSGLASLEPLPGGKTRVRINATPGIAHDAHIHAGSCAALGPIEFPLGEVMGGHSETVISTTVAHLLGSPHAIRLHKEGDSGVFTACGDILPPAPSAPVLIELSHINVVGDWDGDGIVLRNAGDSAVEGNSVMVWTMGAGMGILVDHSPKTQIASLPGGSVAASGHGGSSKVVIQSFSTEMLGALTATPVFAVGTGIAVDMSAGTSISGTSVSVLDAVEGIGILVLGSPGVSVADSTVKVRAVDMASGVVVGDGSHNFSMSGSTVNAESNWQAEGVHVADSDRARLAPKMDAAGKPIGPGNTIKAWAHPLPGVFEPNNERVAVGVVVEGSSFSEVRGSNISAISEIFHDGAPFMSGAAGVLELFGSDGDDQIIVSNNTILADAGKELVVAAPAFDGETGELVKLFQQAQQAAADAGAAELSGFAGASASAVGVWIVGLPGSTVDGNNLVVNASLNLDVPGVDAAEAFSEALGVGVVLSENTKVTRNTVRVRGQVTAPIAVMSDKVESFASTVLNGLGVSTALGVGGWVTPEIVISGNTLAVTATTMLVVSAGTLSDTMFAASMPTPSMVQVARQVALEGAEERGLPVGGLANNKFANAEGVALAQGVELFAALKAKVEANNIKVDSLVDVKATAGSKGPAKADVQAFALGESLAGGVHAALSDMVQVRGNAIGVGAGGRILGHSDEVLTTTIPILGAFGLADVHAEADGVVIEASKKAVVANNGVSAFSMGIATAAGHEFIVKPMLPQGWSFGTADAFGIIGMWVDQIAVEGNGVNARAEGRVLGVATQRPVGPAPMAEAVASGWSLVMGIGVAASDMPSIQRNNVNASGTVGLDTFAESLGGDAALAQSVVSVTGVGVGEVNSPKVLSNTVMVLSASSAQPRRSGAKAVEDVRQCHIETFATGINVVRAARADVIGNRVGTDTAPVLAMANCELPPGEAGDKVSVAHPEVTNVASADAAGIWVSQAPQSHVNGNRVETAAVSLGQAKAVSPAHPAPAPVPAAEPTVAIGISEAIARGITVRRSPEIEVAFNHVGSNADLTVVAVSSDSDTPFTMSTAAAADDLRTRAAQILSHGGSNFSEVSGLGIGEGIGVFHSMDSLVKNNTVRVDSNGLTVGVAIDTVVFGGDAFTFGSVASIGFGILVNNLSDGSWVVNNDVRVGADGDLVGLAEAVTREDPLVFGVTLGVAVGIDNFDSFSTLISENNVQATAGSHGAAFAREFVVPLDANALQIGLSLATGIQVAASVDVEVSDNTVKANSDAQAVAVAEEVLLPAAAALSVGQSQAMGINVLPFPMDESGAAAARVVSPAADDPELAFHVWGIQVLDNTVLSSTASAFAVAVAKGLTPPDEQLAAAFALARGIEVVGIFDSVVAGNTVLEVWAASDATNAPAAAGVGAASHLPEPITAVSLWQSADIHLVGAVDTRVALNNVNHGPSLVGLWIDHSHVILASGNNVGRHKWGIAVDFSTTVALEENVVSANKFGVDIVNGWRVAANFNDIAGNEVGLRYSIKPEEGGAGDVGAAFHPSPLPPFPPVDATYNWWGHATGPSGLGAGKGDKVVFRVLDEDGTALPTGSLVGVVFSPWLTVDALDVLAEGVGHLGFQRDMPLKLGWNTLSTPISLRSGATTDTDWDRLGNVIAKPAAVQVAYTFDAATQTWKLVDSNYELRPLDGVYVKLAEGSQARFIASTELSGPATKRLSKNWNLVSLAAPLVQVEHLSSDAGAVGGEAMPPLVDVFGRATFFRPLGVRQALVSVEVAGTTDVPGWNQVLSPANNAASWVFTFNMPGSQPSLRPFEAYWVQMENPDDLGGFSSTPLGLPTWGHSDD